MFGMVRGGRCGSNTQLSARKCIVDTSVYEERRAERQEQERRGRDCERLRDIILDGSRMEMEDDERHEI